MITKRAQVVVITGVSAGVGRATARQFGLTGAKVALLSRGVDRLEAAADEVRKAGGEALVVPVDMSDAAAMEMAAERVEDKLCLIDIWINNVMATVFGEVGQISPEQCLRVAQTIYLGTVHTTQSALRRMRPRYHRAGGFGAVVRSDHGYRNRRPAFGTG